MENFSHDDKTLEDFVRRLANTKPYHSWEAGDFLSDYWKEEAQEWVRELDFKSNRRSNGNQRP